MTPETKKALIRLCLRALQPNPEPGTADAPSGEVVSRQELAEVYAEVHAMVRDRLAQALTDAAISIGDATPEVAAARLRTVMDETLRALLEEHEVPPCVH